MEPKGRVGLGRGGSTRTSIGMEPILDQQGNTSSPSERTFSAPYIVTAMRGIQLCSGSSRYSCRLSGLNQGSTPLRATGRLTGADSGARPAPIDHRSNSREASERVLGAIPTLPQGPRLTGRLPPSSTERKCSVFRITKTHIRTESLRTQVSVAGKRNF